MAYPYNRLILGVWNLKGVKPPPEDGITPTTMKV